MKKSVKRTQQKLHRVADNLYRASGTRFLYAIIKSHGKQFKRSLKTDDPALARRRLRDFAHKIERFTTNDSLHLPFTEYDQHGQLVGGLAKRWFDLAKLNWKPSVIDREQYTVKELAKYFGHMTVADITGDVVERWAVARAAECAASTFNRDRGRLSQICKYAVRKGFLLENPVAYVPRRKTTKYVPKITSPEEFAAILHDMRSARGKRPAIDSANLCEGLTYVGTRKGDAEWLEVGHINFENKTVTITGDPRTGTKNHEARVIPLFKPFERLLRQMLAALPEPPLPTDKVFRVKSCRSAFENACRRLGLPHYPPHHTWRRLFISNCVMAGIDAATIANWVGHKDGGRLVQTTYTVIPEEHSRRMAERVTFDVTKLGEYLPRGTAPKPDAELQTV
jgi:integrase